MQIIDLIKQNLRLLLGAIVVIFVAIFILTFALSRQGTRVLVNGEVFNVTIAKSDQEKQIGLSKTQKISENQGMLFVFDTPSYYSFWMKDMKFPIDIIYINGDEVVTVIDNARPPTEGQNLEIYQPEDKADKVLEVNAGISKKYNIKKGTTVKIENL